MKLLTPDEVMKSVRKKWADTLAVFVTVGDGCRQMGAASVRAFCQGQ
jgi:hypothetical protein